MRKQLLRLLRIAPLALMFASVAFAQTTGTIIGVVTDASTNKPVAGALVIATSPNLQGEQTAVTDNAGNFRITQLPPGTYRLAVQLEGFNPAERADITVRPDKTLRANLAVVPSAVQMEEQVVRTGVAPVVNVGTAEAGTVVSKEFIAAIPIARGYEGVAIVAPTARNDLYGVSFAGAQSPENQYIVDGMNTTDPTYGTRGGGSTNPPDALRSNFVQEVDVKTGSFSAEYGRATGGILNVILKGGSNEFHGSVFSSFRPGLWVEPAGEVIGSAGEAIAFRSKPDEGSYALDLGFEVGGPIMKDKLWFYGGFAPVLQKNYYERFLRRNVLATDPGGCPAGYEPNASGQCRSTETNDFAQTKLDGTSTVLNTDRQTYQWVGKLTYLLNPDNTFTVSGWGAPYSRTTLQSSFRTGRPIYAPPGGRLNDTDGNQTAVLGRWTGKYLSRKLLPEIQVGWYRTNEEPKSRSSAGFDQLNTAAVEWLPRLPVTTFETAPECTGLADCPVSGYVTGGRGYTQVYTTDRYAGKASLSYLVSALGLHNLKGGVDLERLRYESSKRYSGGSYWEYRGGAAQTFRAFRGYGVINDTVTGSTENTDNPAFVANTEPSNTSETDSFAYFIQDSWQIIPSVTLNAGLRLETQSMKNLDFPESTGFDIKDNWSPRLQAIWDFTGNGRGKVAASWGRFYYALPLDMGERSFGQEITLRYSVGGCGLGTTANAATFNTNNVGFQNPQCTILNTGSNAAFGLLGSGLVPADPNLDGQYVDQFGGQIEYEVLPDLSLALEYQGRRQGTVIEDLSPDDGTHYFIGNPGSSRVFIDPSSGEALSAAGVTTFDPMSGRALQIAFPEPERSYDAITLKATKNFSKNWLAQASYTYSYLRGNYAGPYRPEDGQLDPGITSEYDLASLMANKEGYLPGDQPHQIKLFGAYNFPITTRFNVTTSAAYNGASGVPVNALGAHPLYGSGQAFLVPRGMAGRTPFLHTFDLGAAMEYVIRAPYAVNFRVDVFNVLNRQGIQEIDEDYTFDTVAPITGISCGSKASAGKPNAVAALQSDCPDLAYLRTVDGRPVSVNPNWGRPQRSTTAFQAPLSLRLSLAFTF